MDKILDDLVALLFAGLPNLLELGLGLLIRLVFVFLESTRVLERYRQSGPFTLRGSIVGSHLGFELPELVLLLLAVLLNLLLRLRFGVSYPFGAVCSVHGLGMRSKTQGGVIHSRAANISTMQTEVAR